MHPCVRAILCSLSSIALGALVEVLNAQIKLLQVEVNAFQAQLLQYDIIYLPVEAAGGIARAALTDIRNSALILPLQLIANCVDLGDVNINLQRSIDTVTAELDAIVGDLTRILSYKEELQATIEELNGIIAQFQDILVTIASCGPLLSVTT